MPLIDRDDSLLVVIADLQHEFWSNRLGDADAGEVMNT